MVGFLVLVQHTPRRGLGFCSDPQSLFFLTVSLYSLHLLPKFFLMCFFQQIRTLLFLYFQRKTSLIHLYNIYCPLSNYLLSTYHPKFNFVWCQLPSLSYSLYNFAPINPLLHVLIACLLLAFKHPLKVRLLVILSKRKQNSNIVNKLYFPNLKKKDIFLDEGIACGISQQINLLADV